jgi:hypothetical protein
MEPSIDLRQLRYFVAVAENGEAVSQLVAEWAGEAPGIAAVPFDPPLSFPIDLASCRPANDEITALVEAALHARDANGWLTQRPPRTESQPV